MWRWFKSLFKKDRGIQIVNAWDKDHIPSFTPFYDKTTDTLDIFKLQSFMFDYAIGFSKKCLKCSRKCNHSHCVYADRYKENVKYVFKCVEKDREIDRLKIDHKTQIKQLKERHNKEISKLKTEYENKMRESQVNIPTQITYGESLKKSDDAVITRSSKKYREFRKKVLKRDEVCQCCGANEDLVVHHIDSYKINKSKRADTTNGVVLCEECHRYYHSLYGTREGVNPFNFAKFMRDYSRTPQTILEGSIVQNNDLNLIEGGN